MTTVNLRYGVLDILVESAFPITIPLPLQRERFPLWISRKQIKIKLLPLKQYIPPKDEKHIPAPICEFYSAMKELGIDCLSPRLHCNSWWKEADTFYGRFPYETDNFLLEITPGKSQVVIYGNEFNLNRVILDILACFAVIPPLHGAAVKKGEKTIILLGRSGCGKTVLLKHLIENNYTYIADEEIFWIDNKIFCCGRVIIEKGGRPNIFPKNCLDSDTACPVTDVFLLTDNAANNAAPVLLPVIARQSFWAQLLAESGEKTKMIERLSTAIGKYSRLLEVAGTIEVDHADIENSICAIVRSLFS